MFSLCNHPQLGLICSGLLYINVYNIIVSFPVPWFPPPSLTGVAGGGVRGQPAAAGQRSSSRGAGALPGRASPAEPLCRGLSLPL